MEDLPRRAQTRLYQRPDWLADARAALDAAEATANGRADWQQAMPGDEIRAVCWG